MAVTVTMTERVTVTMMEKVAVAVTATTMTRVIVMKNVKKVVAMAVAVKNYEAY